MLNKKIILWVSISIIAALVLFFVITTTYSRYNKAKLEREWKRQESVFQERLKNSPNDDTIYSSLGQIYVMKEQIDLAENYLVDAIELNPHNKEASAWLIYVFLKKGEREKALSLSQECIKKFPESENFYEMLGAIYEMNNEYERAIEMLKKQKFLLERKLQSIDDPYSEDYKTALLNVIKEINKRTKKLNQKLEKTRPILDS